MPPVIVGAALSAGVGAVLGGTFTTLFVQNLALGLVAKALAPKPPSSTVQSTDNTQSVRSPVASRKLVYGRTRIGGTMVYLETTGADNKYLHMVLALAPHEIDAVEKIYFDDELVWDAGTYQDDWSTYARINTHLGAQTTADSDLVSESSHWTTSHVLNDIAYLYLRLKFDRDKFANGVPNVSAVVRGKKVYDPRTSTTAWSQNPALCIRDYMLDTRYGMAVSASELNVSSWNAAANLCDEIVATTEGTQKRYEFDGVIDTATSRKSIIEAMLSSMGGSLVYSGGAFYVDGASYNTPTVTLDESMIVDAISVQTRRSSRESFNGVKGVFSSIDDNYVLTDYPAVISSAYIASDGQPSYLDVDLPYTTDVLRAERIAKLTLLRSRKQITATIRCNLKALSLKAGDNVMITNERMGWSSKVFEVTNLSFEADGDGRLSVMLNVIENDPAVYVWTTADEIAFVAGQPTTLATPFSVQAPTGLSVVNNPIIQDDGTARPAFDITFTNNDAYATMFEIQYRSGTNSFRSILTNETNYRIEDIIVSASYDIQVRAINRLGARSAFATATQTGAGDGVAPSAPSNLSATGQLNSVLLQWTNPSDSDLDIIEIYEGTSSVQANAVLVGTTKSNSYIRGALQNGVTRYYWIKALDYSGNRSEFNSATGVSATTTVPDLIDETQFIGRIEKVESLTTGLGADDTGKVELLTTATPPTLYKWSGTEWVTGVVIADDVGEILAQHIAVTELSAISANVGTLSAGVIQSTNGNLSIDLSNETLNVKSAASGERLEITNDVIRVYDASGVLRVKLGDLS